MRKEIADRNSRYLQCSKRKFDGCDVFQAWKRHRAELGKASHINDLPQEVLKHVFSYLSTKNKLSSSLVCQTWLNAMDDSSLMRGICVCLRQENFQEGVDRLANKKDGFFSRKFTTFKFCCIGISNEVLYFLQEYGDKIKVLTLEKCRLRKDLVQFNIKKSYCSNIEDLKFHECVMDMFHTLPFLKKLTIDCSAVTDHFIATLGKATSRIEVLKINLYQEYFSSDEEVYGGSWSGAEKPSKRALTVPVLFEFIKFNCQTLVEIDLGHVGFWRIKLYNEILQLTELKLRKLVLDGRLLYNENLSCVSNILARFPTVTELEMKLSVKDHHLDSVCSSLPNLTHLSLTSAYGITSLRNVFALKQLRSLRIEGHVCNEIFAKALNYYQLHRLRHLQLCDNIRIRHDTLRSLLRRMTGLHSLCLVNVKWLTDKILQFISQYLVHLRSLEIKSNNLSDEAVLGGSSPKQSLCNLRELRSLKIECGNVTSAALLKTVKFLKLHTLTVNFRIDADSNFKEEIRKNNPSLCTFCFA